MRSFIASWQYLAGFLGTLAALAGAAVAISSCDQAPAIPRDAGQLTITDLVGTPGQKYCGYDGTVINSGGRTLTIPIISVQFSSDGALTGITQAPTDIHPLAPGQSSTFRFMFACERWENMMRFSARDGSTEIEILDEANR